jgi:hypothetical protein
MVHMIAASTVRTDNDNGLDLIQAQIDRAIWESDIVLANATLARIDAACRVQRMRDDARQAMIKLSEAQAALRLL